LLLITFKNCIIKHLDVNIWNLVCLVDICKYSSNFFDVTLASVFTKKQYLYIQIDSITSAQAWFSINKNCSYQTRLRFFYGLGFKAESIVFINLFYYYFTSLFLNIFLKGIFFRTRNKNIRNKRFFFNLPK